MDAFISLYKVSTRFNGQNEWTVSVEECGNLSVQTMKCKASVAAKIF